MKKMLLISGDIVCLLFLVLG